MDTIEKPILTLRQIYDSDKYKYLANAIESHMHVVTKLIADLDKEFPAKDNGEDRRWTIMGNNRPYLMTLGGDYEKEEG